MQQHLISHCERPPLHLKYMAIFSPDGSPFATHFVQRGFSQVGGEGPSPCPSGARTLGAMLGAMGKSEAG